MRNSLILNRLVLPVAALAVCLVFGSQTALADVLYNVDMNEASAGSPTMSGAAVLGAAGDQWTGFAGPDWIWGNVMGTPVMDSTGSFAAGVTMDVTNFVTSSDWPTGNNPNPQALMEDYICNPGWGASDGWPIQTKLNNLPASTPFTLVVYASSGGGQGGEITLFDPSGNIVKDTTGTTRDITTGVGDAYQIFNGTTDASGGVYFEVKTITDDWHAVNGLQIDFVPEPSTIVLLLMGGLMMLLRLRKC